jgi:predicted ATP-grasp superfamily ATP-dependent carboligase
MLVAFEGWTDAGAAASAAGAFLSKTWGARAFAEIDPEEFYDFTEIRPQVRLEEAGDRRIVWPENRFYAAAVPGSRDLVVMIGVEPQMRWRTFARCVTTVAAELGVSEAITLGAMLADVPHTRAVPVRGSTADSGLARRFGFRRPLYEGPTGIVGVLQDALSKMGIPVASLMAQVPHYVAGTPSPKATLAIVRRVADLLAIPVPTAELERAAVAYERQVSEVVAGDDDMVGYVAELERHADEDAAADPITEIPSADALAAELERFLRQQGGPDER